MESVILILIALSLIGEWLLHFVSIELKKINGKLDQLYKRDRILCPVYPGKPVHFMRFNGIDYSEHFGIISEVEEDTVTVTYEPSRPVGEMLTEEVSVYDLVLYDDDD